MAKRKSGKARRAARAASSPKPNGRAKKAEPKEREISEAAAWELRYQQAAEENARLRAALLAKDEQNLSLRKQLLQIQNAETEERQKELFQRLDLRPGDALVGREGKFLIVSEPSGNVSAPPAPGGTMDPPGGVPDKE